MVLSQTFEKRRHLARYDAKRHEPSTAAFFTERERVCMRTIRCPMWHLLYPNNNEGCAVTITWEVLQKQLTNLPVLHILLNR